MSTHQPRELSIKISDEIMKGTYANSLLVSHTAEEFVLDFVLALPPQAVCGARVIVHPSHVKRIIKALQQNLARFEEKHGPVADQPDPGARIGFTN